METAAPWFIFDKRYEYLLTIEAKNYLKKIKDLLNQAESIKTESDEVYKDYKNRHMSVKEEFEKVDLEKLAPEEKINVNLLVEKNKEGLEHAYNVISYINNILKKFDEDVLRVNTEIKNKTLVEDMVRISQDYGTMKHYNPRSVVLKYSKEKKLVK